MQSLKFYLSSVFSYGIKDRNFLQRMYTVTSIDVPIEFTVNSDVPMTSEKKVDGKNWAPYTGAVLFRCRMYRSVGVARSLENTASANKCCWLTLRRTFCTEGEQPELHC